MRKLFLVALIPLGLGGCFSFHESAPPPKNTTIVVPPGSTVTCSNGVVGGTPGGPAGYTIGQVQTMCPSALVIGFGVNIGSNNPGYVVRTDGFDFNGTTYDFQLTNTPTSKDQCKKDGFVNLTDAQGNAFRNQGQCVSFFEHED